MHTEVIILAQGSQKRLGMAHGYKQLLPLPACTGGVLPRAGGMPILERTYLQVADRFTWPYVTLVSTEDLRASPRVAQVASSIDGRHVELPNPGNSSLKGIARYLESRAPDSFFTGDGIPSRTVVLLGDVVYSWHCLNEIFSLSRTYGFVGTHDLSGSGGELWGVAWALDYERLMLRELADALLRHPPFEDEYQPGQMRRWISGFKRGDIMDHVNTLRRTGHYVDVDDYTRDIDLPEHIALLPKLSESAAADDYVNNAPWSTSPTSRDRA